MYKKSSTGWLKHLDFMVLDIICLQLAFVMGYFLRHHSFKPYGSPIYRNEAIAENTLIVLDEIQNAPLSLIHI